jgi:transcriptional regulator of nitric oxide reductase
VRCNEAVRGAMACLLVAVAATVTSPVALARQSSRPSDVQGVAWSRPTQILSPVVVASWMTERSRDGVERLQLLVLW